MLYAENKEKTTDENETTMFVTGVNCNRDIALVEMIKTQIKFDKTTGNVAYHAYQSFKRGEITPKLAHKIGVELAEKMFPEHQVLVATHLNTGTYHNHFVINSVNMFTGKKFDCNKGAYFRFRGLSDELCEKYNLTVIKNPKGRTARNIYFAEKRGEPTKYNLMRQAIDEAMEMCINYGQFKKIMYKKGYIINDDYNRKYPTIRSINDTKAVRMYRLGEKYTPNAIAEKVRNNPYHYQNKYLEFTKVKKRRNVKRGKYKGSFEFISVVSLTLELIFLTLFYLIGYRKVATKNKSYTPLSPEMKEEVRKLQRYSNQVRLVCKEKLNTLDEVKVFISKINDEINDYIDLRQNYKRKSRNCKDEELVKEYKSKISDCSLIIRKYRYDLKIASQIIEDVPKIKDVIKIERQMQYQGLNKKRTKNKNR
ncbi:MAG TPA: relaxase/mobilization nuclease domain-containing protein [Clostridiaceae bacterium]|nr:relaxase/mobilization nuclease domain-containing protein [Clostridiaceae bacterium]